MCGVAEVCREPNAARLQIFVNHSWQEQALNGRLEWNYWLSLAPSSLPGQASRSTVPTFPGVAKKSVKLGQDYCLFSFRESHLHIHGVEIRKIVELLTEFELFQCKRL